MKIGVIADDFTGATDIASFMVLNGLSTVQLCEVSEDLKAPDVDVVVISHKSRSCPVDECLAQIEKSLNWLLKNNARQIYFKYCSTFDSSAKGNIGPVTDFLMKKLNVDFTMFQPALPVNGRTIYKGYLFVGDVLLSESGMRNHPITPMTESSIPKLVEMQSEGKCAVVDETVLKQGADAVRAAFARAREQGYKYAVLDAIDEDDLLVQGEVLKDFRLVTGGSGLAIGLARALREKDFNQEEILRLGYPQGRHAIVLSGSCSVMTNKQVGFYSRKAAAKLVEVPAIIEKKPGYVESFVDFVKAHLNDEYAPLIYATAEPDKLHEIQKRYGMEASSSAVEQFFAELAQKLYAIGVRRYIIAGGETSSIITKSLKVAGFYIGAPIAPGVPWVRSINNDISLTLKSGNFGSEDFFARAQKDFPV